MHSVVIIYAWSVPACIALWTRSVMFADWDGSDVVKVDTEATKACWKGLVLLTLIWSPFAPNQLGHIIWDGFSTAIILARSEECLKRPLFQWGNVNFVDFLRQAYCLHFKWHPIQYKVHYFWSEPNETWSKVVDCKGNRVPLGMQPSLALLTYLHFVDMLSCCRLVSSNMNV
jgi:hypothetical protein